jgi:hypothetical protein
MSAIDMYREAIANLEMQGYETFVPPFTFAHPDGRMVDVDITDQETRDFLAAETSKRAQEKAGLDCGESLPSSDLDCPSEVGVGDGPREVPGELWRAQLRSGIQPDPSLYCVAAVERAERGDPARSCLVRALSVVEKLGEVVMRGAREIQIALREP